MKIDQWEKMEQRAEFLATWLKDNHPEVFADQRHLDEKTVEAAYWHYGYLLAMRDVLKIQAFYAGDTGEADEMTEAMWIDVFWLLGMWTGFMFGWLWREIHPEPQEKV